MTKCLLVYCNSYMDNLIPVGVSLLSSCLKDAGHDVKLFDTTFYKTADKTGDQARVESLQIKETKLEDFGIKSKDFMSSDFNKLIESYKPDIIGFSVVETTLDIVRVLISSLSLVKEKPLIIMGGIFPTTSPEYALSFTKIICVGEGEKTIVELADKVSRKESIENIPNLWIKKEDGTIIKNSIRPLIDLNKLPHQDWTIYDKERLYKPMGGKVWISGPIELQRGCHLRCGFCCNAFLQDLYKDCGKYPRQKSIQKFIEEVELKQRKYGINYLYLVAENFLSMRKEDFNDFIRLYKPISLPFWIETRPETISEDKLIRMKEVGCEGISIGVEHGNDGFRREVLNRYVTNQMIINAFNIAKKSGIRVCANNIIGFPYETRELVFETINLNRELKADNIMVNIFCPYRGTKLFDVCVGKGYINEYSTAGDYRGLNAGLDMPQLSNQEINNLQKTFPLYVRFNKQRWPEIKQSETDEMKFEKLKEDYLCKRYC